MDKNFPGFEAVINLLPAHAYILDINNTYVSCNELQAKAFGFSDVKEVIGKRNKDIPAFAKYPEITEVLDNNNLQVMKCNSKKIVELEERGINLNGDAMIFKSYKLPLLNKNKQVVGLLGISYDITEYKNKLEEIYHKYDQSELALDNIMENLPGHIYWTDEKNQCLGCNAEQAHAFGFKNRHEAVGVDLSFFGQTPENSATIRQNNAKVMSTGITITAEENFKDLDGIDKVYLSHKTPLKNKFGKTVGLLGISLDITAQKEIERLRYDNIKLENEAYLADKKSQEKVKKFIDKMLYEIQAFRIEELHDKIGIKPQILANSDQIRLTRREQQILYFLSLNKSPKDISQIITIIENKPVSDSTINAVINKKLYLKFNVFNVGQLVEKATMLNLIPLLLES